MPTLRPLVRPAPSSTDEPVVPAQGVANPQKYPVSVGPSAIDGQGAFAEQAIPAKAKIGEIRGEFVAMADARARAKAAERNSGRIFMIAVSDKRAVDATHSRFVYTLMWNQTPVGDAQAQAAAREARQKSFQAAVDKMAEAANAP